MNRLAIAVELAAALTATAYVLIAMAQNPDHPAVGAAELAVGTLLTFAAFVAGLALYVVAQACHAPQLVRRAWQRALEWPRIRRAVRERRRRHRARARIGSAR